MNIYNKERRSVLKGVATGVAALAMPTILTRKAYDGSVLRTVHPRNGCKDRPCRPSRESFS